MILFGVRITVYVSNTEAYLWIKVKLHQRSNRSLQIIRLECQVAVLV